MKATHDVRARPGNSRWLSVTAVGSTVLAIALLSAPAEAHALATRGGFTPINCGPLEAMCRVEQALMINTAALNELLQRGAPLLAGAAGLMCAVAVAAAIAGSSERAKNVQEGHADDVLASIAIAIEGGESWSKVTVRGVAKGVPELRLVEGRAFQPGMHEVIVGERASARYPSLQPGGRIIVGNAVWQIVGVFSSGAAARDSEVLCDGAVLAASIQAAARASQERSFTHRARG